MFSLFLSKFILMRNFTFALVLINIFIMKGQEKLPYYQIPKEPIVFTAGATASRMVLSRNGNGKSAKWI